MTLSLHDIFKRLLAHYGPRHWWPADTPFEMMAGAVLTQNTSWTNVEKAIANLRAADLLEPTRILACSDTALAEAIRPSGFFNQKTARLKRLVRYVTDNESVLALQRRPEPELRAELLAINGIGPETADSILLYALDKPRFVVDAYTRRIFSRLGTIPAAYRYEEIQGYFESHLKPDLHLYQEYHALIVEHAKQHCRSKPQCMECPLLEQCRSDFAIAMRDTGS